MQQIESMPCSLQLMGCGRVTAISSKAEGIFICVQMVCSLIGRAHSQEWHLRCQVKEPLLRRWVLALPSEVTTQPIELAFTVTDLEFSERFSGQTTEGMETIVVMDAVLTQARKI